MQYLCSSISPPLSLLSCCQWAPGSAALASSSQPAASSGPHLLSYSGRSSPQQMPNTAAVSSGPGCTGGRGRCPKPEDRQCPSFRRTLYFSASRHLYRPKHLYAKKTQLLWFHNSFLLIICFSSRHKNWPLTTGNERRVKKALEQSGILEKIFPHPPLSCPNGRWELIWSQRGRVVCERERQLRTTSILGL